MPSLDHIFVCAVVRHGTVGRSIARFIRLLFYGLESQPPFLLRLPGALSSSLFPPLSTSGASPLVWLERSESSIVYLFLSRALERVYARIRFQSLKAGLDGRTNGGHSGRTADAAAKVGGSDAVEARRRLDCRFKAGSRRRRRPSTALSFTWA